MTQKEIDGLTIFLGRDDAFIGRQMKNGKLSKIRRNLTEQEVIHFVTWFVKSYCEKYDVDDFTLNVDGKPMYRLGLVKDEEE